MRSVKAFGRLGVDKFEVDCFEGGFTFVSSVLAGLGDTLGLLAVISLILTTTSAALLSSAFTGEFSKDSMLTDVSLSISGAAATFGDGRPRFFFLNRLQEMVGV